MFLENSNEELEVDSSLSQLLLNFYAYNLDIA